MKSAVRAGSAFLTFLDTQIRKGNLATGLMLTGIDPWYNRTVLSELDLSDGTVCSLAQYGKKNYTFVTEALSLTVSQTKAFGFIMPDFEVDDVEEDDNTERWEYLTDQWRKEIRRLRKIYEDSPS
jgi:hypothetical protein